MTTRTRLLVGPLLLLACTATAQQIRIVGNPVQPGTRFTVVLTNDTTEFLPISASPPLHLLQPGGELIVPELVGCLPVGISLNPGGVTNLSFTAPATGPGSAGSFVLLYPGGGGAVARLDVVGPSAGFPDIHAYPVSTPGNAAGHRVVFPPNQTPDWELSNTGAASHTIAAGFVDVFAPGAVAPVATLSLAGVTIPAGRATRVLLPLAGLVPGPYTVATSWVDPATGALTVARHGIEASSTTAVDMHFPAGKFVLAGGSIPVRLAMRGFTTTAFLPPATEMISYAVVLGLLPGSTPLPGGGVLPVTLDPFVIASFQNGVLGILSNHTGTAITSSVYCAHGLEIAPTANGISITHPNLPVVSGLPFRAAALALGQQSGFAASQPELVTFQ